MGNPDGRNGPFPPPKKRYLPYGGVACGLWAVGYVIVGGSS